MAAPSSASIARVEAFNVEKLVATPADCDDLVERLDPAIAAFERELGIG